MTEKFYMTNLSNKQEIKLKGYIDRNNLGSASLDESSIFIKAKNEKAVDKIREYADRLIKNELK